MTTNETPAETLRRAAKLMRRLAKAATPGSWERPLDVQNKSVVIAALPDNEPPRSWDGGIIPAEFASHSGPMGRYAGQRERVVVVSAPANNIMGFERKRSGRDLEYVASMHPGVGLALADWIESRANDAEGAYELLNGGWAFGACDDPPGIEEALKIARVYLGEAS